MRFAAMCVVVSVALVRVAPVQAQDRLACGTPLFRSLAPGATHTYTLQVPAGAQGVIQSSAISMALGPRRMVLTGPGGAPIANTSTGIIQFAGRSGTLTLRVSQNSGNSGGDYVVALNIVSQSGANCGIAITCGASPDGIGFDIPGEVDSFKFDLQQGVPVSIKTNYLERGMNEQLSLWLFDPLGEEVKQPNCTPRVGPAEFTADEIHMTGTYTALVYACGLAMQGDYRIEVTQPAPVCPVGPTITHFGVVSSDSFPVNPTATDALGRPIYNQQEGGAPLLVIEARAGKSGRNPGLSTVPVADEPAYLQVIFSRPLGDGSPVVCDTMPPNFGGVPATSPFAFDDSPTTLDHIHDMGCRFIDGKGEPAGRTSIEACTKTDDGDFDFVDRGSNLQYCELAGGAWSFQDGDTVVMARVIDTGGNVGKAREIIVRIGDPNPVTSTPTPTVTPRPPTRTITPRVTNTMSSTLVPTRTETRTRTPSRTRTITPTRGTPTATATGPTPTITATRTPNTCPGDCSGNHMVTIDELTRLINIALGHADISVCPAGDADGDGEISIDDLIKAVASALTGCPASLL